MAKLTQKTILATFEAMLREMPFDKITVSALVARCEISSNTFYYHYQDIYDLLNRWLDLKLSCYTTDQGPWKEGLKAMVRCFQDNSAIVSHVFGHVPRDRLERYVFTVMEEDLYQSICRQAADLPEKSARMLAGTLCYTLFGFVLRFVWQGMTVDIDEFFDPVIAFLDQSIRHFMESEQR